MIKVERNRVPMPRILGPKDDARGKKETAQAIKFYKSPSRSKRRFAFKAYIDKSVKRALDELFYGKCAYCESKVSHVAPLDVEQYRPKSGVIGADGNHHPDHYFWLANEWTNLLAACQNCNRKNKVQVHGGDTVIAGKGNQFPIKDEKNRAKILATGQDLVDEEPMILNPCEDDPEEHLVFVEDGTVVSETPRGQLTIDVLGLNRIALVQARYRLFLRIAAEKENMKVAVESNDSKIYQEVYRRLNKFCQPDQEYAGFARQFLNNYRTIEEEDTIELNFTTRGASKKHIEFEAYQKKQKTRVKRATKAYQTFRKEQQHYSLETQDGLEKYFSGPPRFVEEVSIQNLKSISKLKIDLTGNKESTVPWTMILGENGTGKSTILKAITIALIGESYFRELVENEQFDPAGFVRWNTKKGSVSLRISGFPKPRKVYFFPDGIVEFVDSSQAQLLLLAYGSTRLMPRGNSDVDYGREYARVDNLFNRFLPMANTNLWLNSLPSDRFEYAAPKIKELLKLPKSNKLFREDGKVFLQTEHGPVPINKLSDGYQSMMALTADILRVVLSKWPTPDSARGVVLLDEVGNHLHPEWKMRFVVEMRSFFPGIQFIASTHNPLCLFGLSEGEVVVLNKTPKGSIFQVEDLPSIEGLRVDQLLTSEHFGLGSATDPTTQAMLDEYYTLLRSKGRTSDKEKRIKELKTEIDNRQQLGKTERERMLLEVIDQFLAEKPQIKTATARKQLKEDTMNKLRDIWNS